MANPGPVNLKSAATTNATLVNAAPCKLCGWTVYNNSSGTPYAVYLKFYDLARIPVPGTDVPAFKVTVAAGGQGYVDFSKAPIPFTNGLAYAITKNVADSDATAVAVDDLDGTLVWCVN